MQIVAPLHKKEREREKYVTCDMTPVTLPPLYAASAAMKVPAGLVMRPSMPPLFFFFSFGNKIHFQCVETAPILSICLPYRLGIYVCIDLNGLK